MDISTAVVGDGVLVKGVDSASKTVLLEVPSGLVVDVVFTIVVTILVVFVDVPVFVVVVSAIVGDGIIGVLVAFVSAVVNKLLVVSLSTVLEKKI